eukprot:TRINITY_DN3768_c0_g1_i1.p1 TRINITY_DN3768_c0_g1~~TRINITY_DN3768_c0_g1_i1.p1  ORF type:complete len:820 (+),score=242.02 TRINITY_DN3768_c0_g1_i1:192-2651(+)
MENVNSCRKEINPTPNQSPNHSPNSTVSSPNQTGNKLVLTIDIEDYVELKCVRTVSSFFDGNWTIKDALFKIANKGSVAINLDNGEDDNFELLLSGKGKKPTLLDKDRTLASYNFKSKDVIVLRMKRSVPLTATEQFQELAEEWVAAASAVFTPKVDLSKRFIEVEGDQLVGINKLKEKETIRADSLEIPSDKVGKLLINGNRLTSVPESFLNQFLTLKHLNLSANVLSTFPDHLCELTRLEVLHLEENRLQNVSPRISRLYNLQKLYVQKNNISELPEEICLLTSLRILNLDDNKLKKLPIKLGSRTPHLKSIFVRENPLISPPVFVANKGTAAILRYLNAMQQTLRQSPMHQTQKFLFRYKVSFSTNDSKKKSHLSPTHNQQAANHRHSNQASFRMSRQDSIFFPNHTVFFFLEHGEFESQGKSNVMVQKHIAVQPFVFEPNKNQPPANSQMALFGIYDGHDGIRAAEYCSNNLHENMIHDKKSNLQDLPEVFKHNFKKTDYEFLQIARSEGLSNSKSFGILAMLSDNELFVAHVGDSKAAIIRGNEVMILTEDHTSNRSDEIKRIEAIGQRATYETPTVTRAIGDLDNKEPKEIVTSEPEVTSELLSPRDQYVVLATRGIWEFLTEKNILKIVHMSVTCAEASQKLVETAIKKGMKENGTAIVVKLCWYLDSSSKKLEVIMKRNSILDVAGKVLSKSLPDESSTPSSDPPSFIREVSPDEAELLLREDDEGSLGDDEGDHGVKVDKYQLHRSTSLDSLSSFPWRSHSPISKSASTSNIHRLSSSPSASPPGGSPSASPAPGRHRVKTVSSDSTAEN